MVSGDPYPLLLTPAERAQLSGHPPLCVWLTGLSGAGKTTVAQGLERRLYERGIRTMLLDGDILRSDLSSDLGFTAKDRSENLRRAATVARYFVEAGTLVLCAFVSPHAADRARARAMFAPGFFVEVHVKCSVDTCRQRDPKGLYRRAETGELKGLTGVDAPYEAPVCADIVLDTDVLDRHATISQLLDFTLTTLRLISSREVGRPGL